MRIAIFGCGYVGLVTGACLAEVGNSVIGIDIDEEKISSLNAGQIPIYEPGLSDIINRGIEDKNLHFTTDMKTSLIDVDIIFIAVGTPQDEDGHADLSHVLSAAKTIGKYLNTDNVLVVIKSTVPVGTCEIVRQTIKCNLTQPLSLNVASNPEFLKEGAAITDFKRPDRIIVGVDKPEHADPLRQLYSPFNRQHEKLMVMDIRSSELTKYAANAMLAARISFMNEISQIAVRVGADVEQVRQGIGSDPRIGYAFIYPGSGYGGSCFPKDIHALRCTARENNYSPQLLDAIEAVNDRQKLYVFQQVKQHFANDLDKKTIAVWGLSFKPDTDDMREAPSRVLLENLWREGAVVKAYDPKAMPEAKRIYGHDEKLQLCADPYQAINGCDALVVMTEWKSFWSPDFIRIKQLLNNPVVFDGRNIYSPAQLNSLGFTHYSIGRKPVLNEMPEEALALVG
jgi:UDPglucose 6-dehydrogenase